MTIGSLIAITSLNVSLALIQAGQVAGTFPVTGATATTPVVLTSSAHGVPLGRVVHGVSSGIVGTVEANGLFEFQPTDPDHFAVYSYSAQGIRSPLAGSHAYVSGGQIQFAFPEWQILLGRRWVAGAAAVTSPRIVFVPMRGKAWNFEAYGGLGPAPKQHRGSLEQQSQTLNPEVATRYPTFEVHVHGAANPPSPDFGDFDATEALLNVLYSNLFDQHGGERCVVLAEDWPSQSPDAGTQTQRGQTWKGIIQFQQGITRPSLQFVPEGTTLTLTVEPDNAGPTDPQTIVIPGVIG